MTLDQADLPGPRHEETVLPLESAVLIANELRRILNTVSYGRSALSHNVFLRDDGHRVINQIAEFLISCCFLIDLATTMNLVDLWEHLAHEVVSFTEPLLVDFGYVLLELVEKAARSRTLIADFIVLDIKVTVLIFVYQDLLLAIKLPLLYLRSLLWHLPVNYIILRDVQVHHLDH